MWCETAVQHIIAKELAATVEHPVPELPEVETVVRDLRPELIGRRFSTVKFGGKTLRRNWSHDWPGQLRGQRVQAIRRRGKWIVMALDPPRHLVIHLGMTGQLTVVPTTTAVEKHTHLTIGLDGGGRQLRFRDIRRFGSATVLGSAAAVDEFFVRAQLGPEPFELDQRYWRERLAATKRCLKAVLLDQRVVAGVGNIYADEALFDARLHPARLANDLTTGEANRLRTAIRTVLRRAIDKRGSSIRDYVGGSGLRGEYQNEFRAYGRTGEPCVRCETIIKRLVVAGRSAHYCPRCQRES